MDQCCADSPLSMTGSIVGILTFALALLAYYFAFVATTKGAPAEIETFARDLSMTQSQIVPIIEYFEKQRQQANTAYQGHGDSILAALWSLVSTLQRVTTEFSRHRPDGQSSPGMWRRLRWVFDRDDMVESMARISNQKATITATQLSFLLE